VKGKEVSSFITAFKEIIACRKGWGPNGEKDPTTIKSVAIAYMKSYIVKDLLTEPWTDQEAKICDIPTSVKYHPIEATISGKGNNSVITVSYWTYVNEGRGPWKGPPFVSEYCEEECSFGMDGTVIGAKNRHLFSSDKEPKPSITIQI
jgi:hypothetical protein